MTCLENDVRVIDGTEVLTLAQADPSGACQSSNPLANGCVMSRIAHKWNGASYDAFDGQTPGMEGTLENFDGLFVKAFKTGISLRIPENRSTSSAPRAVLAEAPSASTQIGAQFGVTRASELEQQSQSQGLRHGEWFVRLTATDSSGNLIDAGNALGQLRDSNSRYNKHDLIVLEPFGDKYLSIVFPHRDWRAKSGDYTSDYPRVRNNRRSRTWRFDVLSSEPNTEVTLTWAGPERRIESANLIDDVTGEVIDVQPGGSYTFTTSATRHPFTWYQRRPKR